MLLLAVYFLFIIYILGLILIFTEPDKFILLRRNDRKISKQFIPTFYIPFVGVLCAMLRKKKKVNAFFIYIYVCVKYTTHMA